MKKYKVISRFRDLEDKTKTFPNGRVYEVNDPFPATKRKVDEARLSELKGYNNKIGHPVIEESLDEVPLENVGYPHHVGGGYYELSNGERVQGKKAAEQAETDLGGE